MSLTDHYNAIVIGSGQGGTPLASALAEAGQRTALIERQHVGGTCINEGCTPTKAMVASARVAYLARRANDYGVLTGAIRMDMQRVRQRKRNIIDSFRNGSQQRLERTANLDLIFGEASFSAATSLVVRLQNGTDRQLSADRIFINAGTRPGVPKLDGLEGVPFLDSTSIMELDVVPAHLLILGGGYVGVEFGQMFRRFGSRVTIVQSRSQVLASEDSDVAQQVAEILRQDGVEILLNARAERIAQSTAVAASGGSAGSEIQLTVRAEGDPRALSGSHLLVATGRVPNTDSLNLSAAGIATDPRGFINVNRRLETNVEGVYALGDIKGGPAFTHISYDDFRILRTNLLEKGHATIENRFVPYTVFIDPQLGRIGLTEGEAGAQNKKIRVAKMSMNHVARALEVDETRGFMKAIVDAQTGQILGAAVLGIEGGELMSMLEIAMMGELPYSVLREATLAHPTLAESLNNLFTHFSN
jgi:pyruvate/2-oxoglutarate dehydrogenase complex dihydrolipoamide dehydrogenase (E3) component